MSDGVTFINVFEIDADRVDEFVGHWRERAELLRGAPGFRDVRLHRALLPDSRFQLVNVAHWDSEEEWRAATQSHGQFQSSVAEAARVATPNPALYQVVVEISG
ncbi:antibiotic biosynthesis monooxygenase [Amycolatopsis sp. 195334CR]|uniref:antibiotic biosynthesis monooxygenase family protein n=1 Tax=Amycolatopsis sp. 195334CR TaxID=2814588 RepID=UPI001A8EC4B6|nr:antibiotic biosynthesis monooxygenase family protein [Amycolatopsis sp. 195334CR]MBN6041174.1 antibiotic biosynthesis monooxygenase [Amycolatopsis sp. 195334CR]